jgi:hypothetical protein
MVEFDVKVNPEQHSAYIPKEVIKALGTKLKILPNSRAAIIYPAGTKLKDVLASVEILSADLKHRIEMDNQHEKELKEEAEKTVNEP